MGSFRVIYAGPPSDAEEFIQKTQNEIQDNGSIKSNERFGELATGAAFNTLKKDGSFDGYAYLEVFQRVKALNWLSSLESKGHDVIVGGGLWFVSYDSPVNIIERNRSDTILYDLEKGSSNSSIPFSYDPDQDYKTEK